MEKVLLLVLLLISLGKVLVVAQIGDAVNGTDVLVELAFVRRFIESGQSRVVTRSRKKLLSHQVLRVASHSLDLRLIILGIGVLPLHRGRGG